MEGLQIPQNAGQGGPDTQEAEAKRAQEEQMRRDMIATVLDTAARERLSRIAMVSPERSRQIETILVRMAQAGQLKGRVTENQLIELLEQMEEASGQGKPSAKKSTILYQRKTDFDDDFDI
ncbi:PDCD5-related protein [Mycena floridula]|nr:PDCD5-related protein [Mycena floridula]